MHISSLPAKTEKECRQQGKAVVINWVIAWVPIAVNMQAHIASYTALRRIRRRRPIYTTRLHNNKKENMLLAVEKQDSARMLN